MAAPSFIIDDPAEDATNVALDLTDGVSTFLLEYNVDPPPDDPMYASSADVEGARLVQHRPQNREVPLKVRFVGETAAALEDTLGQLSQKLAKINRDATIGGTGVGGTLRHTTPNGTVVMFDLIGARHNPQFDRRYVLSNVCEVAMTFEALSYGRGEPETLADHTETTLPCLVFTADGVAGDVPALGRLVIDEDQGVDQWWLVWGLQSKNYDAAASGGLFYEAEALTAQGGSAAAVGPSGASGSTTNKVMANTNLATTYQSILSTEIAATSTHLSHVGTFRVFARVQCPTSNAGVVSVALEWGEGDLRVSTQSPGTDLDPTWEGTWRIVDLGLVSPTKVAQGTQRWEGRVLAKSTAAGDDVNVDCLWLVPADEGYAEVTGRVSVASPTSFVARDEFDQTSGSLTAKTLPTGGTWTFLTGDTDDYTIGSGLAQRTATVDSAARIVTAGTTSYSAIALQYDFTSSDFDASGQMGVVLRLVDSSNYLRVLVGSRFLGIQKVIAGAATSVATGIDLSITSATFYTIRAVVDAAGRVWVWFTTQGTVLGQPVIIGYDPALATGGTLASGKIGLYDDNTGGAAVRSWDNFAAWVPVADAAVFASQSIEIRHDRVIREDSGGAVWTGITPEGGYLYIPPAGREGRTSRLIVKACRNDPDALPDPAIDDISARLTYTPRYLVLPS